MKIENEVNELLGGAWNNLKFYPDLFRNNVTTSELMN